VKSSLPFLPASLLLAASTAAERDLLRGREKQALPALESDLFLSAAGSVPQNLGCPISRPSSLPGHLV